MSITFTIKLEEQIIGTTEFEFADAPMGVVYGKIKFINIESPYLLFKNIKFKLMMIMKILK